MKTLSFATPFLPGLLRCLIYFMLEERRKSTKIGLEKGVTTGDDTTKSGKKTHLLVIMCLRLLQKIGLLDLKNRNWFKKGNS